MDSPIWRKSLANAYPVPYFLHGALSDPKKLKRAFTLNEEPRLKKARIVGYRRVRHVKNWVLISAECPSEELLRKKTEEVEGVVYNVSNPNEVHRIEKHAQAEYGVGSYATVPVEIEILAQGARRARKIEGRAIIYTGGRTTLELDPRAPAAASRDHAVGIQRAKQLARKPVPVKPQPAPINFTPSLARSPSLNLASVLPRPASYHGASISGTQIMLSERGVSPDTVTDDILQYLNEEIARVHEDWKNVTRHIRTRSMHQQVSSPLADLQMVSALTKKVPDSQNNGKVICGPRPLFAHRKDDKRRTEQRTNNSIDETLLSQVFPHHSESNDMKTTSKSSSRRTPNRGMNIILPALPEHVAIVDGTAEGDRTASS